MFVLHVNAHNPGSVRALLFFRVFDIWSFCCVRLRVHLLLRCRALLQFGVVLFLFSPTRRNLQNSLNNRNF